MTSSVGIVTFPIYGKIKAMFQITDQLYIDIYIYITVIIKPSTTITNLVGISISIVGATMTILILMISVV